MKEEQLNISIGTHSLILSKLYYSVLSKKLENIELERYYSILVYLYKHNGCNQQCICNALMIDKTAMVKIIDYLIKCDLINKNINPNDRREHFIELTPKGIIQAKEVNNAFKILDETILKNISKEEQDTFLKVLCQLSENLKQLPYIDLFFNYKKTARKRNTSKTK